MTETAREEFSYTMGGLLNRFVKYDFEENYSCDSDSPLALTDRKWDWRYRYGPKGAREQKRLYYSPHGDGMCGDTLYSHPWVYYLRGAGGEMLAMYYGRQTSATITGCDPIMEERRVYMYPAAYLSAGGSIITKPDSTKDYQITDNLGSVRCVVSYSIALDSTIAVKGYDYKPYGDTLSTEGGERTLGFIGRERDTEGRYCHFGARQYDPQVEKIRNEYRRLLIIKNPKALDPTGKKMRERLKEARAEYGRKFGTASVRVRIDIDSFSGN